MKTPLVSIVMPTYNRAKFLNKAVGSVIKQKYKNWELIIIDDGSTDETEDVLSNFKDRRIKYIRARHKGSTSARKKGIKTAKGKIITFLDSDDWYSSLHLKKCLTYLQKHPEFDMIRGVPKIYGPKYVSDKNHPSKKIHLKNCSIFGTFFIRDYVIPKIKKWPKKSFGDDFFLFNLLKGLGIKSKKILMLSYNMNRRPHSSITLCHDKLFICDQK